MKRWSKLWLLPDGRAVSASAALFRGLSVGLGGACHDNHMLCLFASIGPLTLEFNVPSDAWRSLGGRR